MKKKKKTQKKFKEKIKKKFGKKREKTFQNEENIKIIHMGLKW